jgi:uncharacterized protein (DUF2147 family)
MPIAPSRVSRLIFAVLIFSGGAGETSAQSPAEGKDQPAMLAQAAPEFSRLIGRWVRPDGGYVIDVKEIDASGKMAATYLNPKPIGVSKADVSIQGDSLKIFIELRGAGYPGSTYTLTYVPSMDHLIGVYFQAVAQQKFDVVFVRAK